MKHRKLTRMQIARRAERRRVHGTLLGALHFFHYGDEYRTNTSFYKTFIDVHCDALAERMISPHKTDILFVGEFDTWYFNHGDLYRFEGGTTD